MSKNEKLKDILVEEIHFAVEKMEQSTKSHDKLFYFSAIHGLINRIINLEYDPDLLYTHFILSAVHQNFLARLQAIQAGVERTIPLTDHHFKRLSVLSKELAKKFDKGEDTHKTLRDFVVLAYSTTGNGYYLLEKGLLKI